MIFVILLVILADISDIVGFICKGIQLTVGCICDIWYYCWLNIGDIVGHTGDICWLYLLILVLFDFLDSWLYFAGYIG